MLKLYLADVSKLPLSYDIFSFSEYRLKKLKKQKHEKAIRQSIGAELLLIHAVKELYPEKSFPLEICQDDLGKPHLKNVPLHFSLSHSENYAACAVSDQSVGLDIEQALKCREHVAERFFSENEQSLLISSCNKDLAFSQIWTAKESILKYLGIGLRHNLKELDTTAGASYHIYKRVVDDVVISLCTEMYLDSLNIEFLNLDIK